MDVRVLAGGILGLAWKGALSSADRCLLGAVSDVTEEVGGRSFWWAFAHSKPPLSSNDRRASSTEPIRDMRIADL